jgi:hypothetical protein
VIRPRLPAIPNPAPVSVNCSPACALSPIPYAVGGTTALIRKLAAVMTAMIFFAFMLKLAIVFIRNGILCIVMFMVVLLTGSLSYFDNNIRFIDND